MNNEALVGSGKEKDLGIIVSSALGQRKHWIKARNKANRVLGIILMSVKSTSPEVISKLHLALARPHLGDAV